MSGLAAIERNPRLLIWGQGERVAPLWRRLENRVPICWVYHRQQTIPEDFKGQTIWGVSLLKLQGSYGQFVCQFSDGSQTDVGMAALFTEAPVLDGPKLTVGQSVAMLLAGTYRGVFARALKIALGLAGEHQVYVITDDVQVGYPGGEEEYSRARAAGVVFFRASEWQLNVASDEGYEIWLPRQNVLLRVDQVADYRQVTAAAWPRDLRLGPMSVSGVLDTRREGVYAFPAGDEIAPSEEEMLYDALAARLIAKVEEKAFDQKLEVDAACCALCLTCYRVCPHQAINLVSGPAISNLYGMSAAINPSACQGCAACWAACPAAAIRWRAAPQENGIILACENSGWNTGMASQAAVRLYPCANAISSADILQALTDRGRVLIYACREGSCRHQGCAPEVESRLDRLRGFMQQLGMTADIRLLRKSVAEIGYAGEGSSLDRRRMEAAGCD